MGVNERSQVVLVNRCIIQDDESRILLVKREPNSSNPCLWEAPGGKLDKGQDLDSAREREIEEETGLTVELTSPLVYADSFILAEGKYRGLPYIALFSLAKATGGHLRLSHEHTDSTWVHAPDAFNYDLTRESEKALRFIGATLLDS